MPNLPIDVDRLRRWMDDKGLAGAPITDFKLLTGGTQNILVRFQQEDRCYVLRRPPMHPRAESNETMRREARVLKALAASGVPHPAIIAVCEDTEVLGAVFFIMEAIDGFNALGDGLPPLHASDPSIRHRMGLAMVDAIAALGQLDPQSLGLADLGKPERFLERQVQRWRKQLDGYAAFTEWPGPAALPHVDTVGAWLEAHRPAQGAVGLMHGDYHLANVMFRHDGPELAAVIDWEMATQGDPLLDLGWLLATWPRGDEPEGQLLRLRPWSGFPTPAQLVARYGQQSPRDITAIRWYAVLACYKLAIVLEGTYARACAGHAPKAAGDQLHRQAVSLLGRAVEWIEGGSL
ncbi:phosphotransferase family protein [Ramlibacter sp. WS9]|uniref:phosphotransferase family protein n=1 Tax=Ramlibacter sp. WS9 TaxID=1882741 RepID=UPI0018EE7FBB|nr:phosphotransferase family protein [Ramlibacter sp. WS9]